MRGIIKRARDEGEAGLFVTFVFRHTTHQEVSVIINHQQSQAHMAACDDRRLQSSDGAYKAAPCGDGAFF